MTASEEAMGSRPGSMGAGMAEAGGSEMDPAHPALHTLDAGEQLAKMGLASTADASVGAASEGMATDEEIGRLEQALKLGTRP